MVDLLFAEDNQALLEPGTVRTIYDPTFMRNFRVSRDIQICVAAVTRPVDRASANRFRPVWLSTGHVGSLARC